MKRDKLCKLQYLSIIIALTISGQTYSANDVFYPVTFDANGNKKPLVFGAFSKSELQSEERNNLAANSQLTNTENTKLKKQYRRKNTLNNKNSINQDLIPEDPSQSTGIDVSSLIDSQYVPTIKGSGVEQNTSGNLDLHHIINMAISWHPTIKRSGREIERAREGIEEASAAYYPSLNVGVKTGLEQNDYGSGNDRSNKVTVVAEQMIYDFGKTKTKVDLNELNTIYTEYELEREINDITYQTVNAYLQVVKYKKLITIADDQLLGFTKINEIAKKRTNLGASAESDYSQSKVRLASSVSQLNDYKSQYNRWSATLDNLTNTQVSDKIIIQFPQELQSSCSVHLNEALSSPLIRIAESQVNVARKQIDLANTEHYPTISVNPFYEYEMENRNNNGYSNRNQDKFGVYLNIKAPLYQGGAVSSRVRQAEQALYAANHNLESEFTNTRLKISESSSQVENAKLSLSAKLNRATESIRTRDLYMLQYEQLGTRSFTDLISAESEIHQTKMDIVNSEYNIANFSVECLYQTGELAHDFSKL
ncbi:MAG TPA: hypothetical protein DIT05_12925 [Morganella sp. (in: Bacteria)]|nr:hypothetical protein [Morganella sp. (in: enterobacteria)]